jgi:hypothetical protein
MSHALLRRRAHQPRCLPCDPADLSLTNIPVNEDAGRRTYRRTKQNPTRSSRCTVCRRDDSQHTPSPEPAMQRTSDFTARSVDFFCALLLSRLATAPRRTSRRTGTDHVSTTRPARRLAVAIGAAPSQRQTASSQHTSPHLIASSRFVPWSRKTALPTDAPRVAAKHSATGSTVARGVNSLESVNTSSELILRRTSSSSSRSSRRSEEHRSQPMYFTLP